MTTSLIWKFCGHNGRVWLAVLLLALAGCGERRAPDFYQGYIRAELVYVAAPVGGWLEELTVARGQAVTQGAALFTLDPAPEIHQADEAEAGLRQAEAQIRDLRQGARPEDLAVLEQEVARAAAARQLADLDAQRISGMFSNQFSSASDYDRAFYTSQQADAVYRQALSRVVQARLAARTDQIDAMQAEGAGRQAALDRQKWIVAQKLQVARVDSMVYDTLYREGEWVGAGAPVVALLAPDLIRVRFFVRTDAAAGLQIGREVWFAPTADGPFQKARVDYVSPKPEYTPPVIFSRDSSSKQVFMVEAMPEHPRQAFHPGLPVEVYLRRPIRAPDAPPKTEEQ